jgi:hypothetical protein
MCMIGSYSLPGSYFQINPCLVESSWSVGYTWRRIRQNHRVAYLVQVRASVGCHVSLSSGQSITASGLSGQKPRRRALYTVVMHPPLESRPVFRSVYGGFRNRQTFSGLRMKRPAVVEVNWVFPSPPSQSWVIQRFWVIVTSGITPFQDRNVSRGISSLDSELVRSPSKKWFGCPG